MIPAILKSLTNRIREAAASEDPSKTIRAVLQESQSEQSALADAIGDLDEDEVLVFEDNTCSIWTCRYGPKVVFAPHEHCMVVHIAVYRGTEIEVLYKRESGAMRHGGNHQVKAGDIARLGADVVHAVTADGPGQSIAIHVYEGPLTQIERSLFDWQTGEAVKFSMKNFHAMARRKADMTEFS